MKLSVYSEIGNLKKVLLHRPSNEIENLTPEMLGKLLFDDIPFLEVAQQEHDYFANVLKKQGVEVYYLAKLAAEAIEQEQVKLKFLSEFLDDYWMTIRPIGKLMISNSHFLDFGDVFKKN